MNFKHTLEHHLLDHVYEVFHLPFGINIVISKHLLLLFLVPFLMCGLIMLLFRTKKFRFLIRLLVLFVRENIVVACMGKEGKKYLNYFLTLFFFILVSNLMGLVPYLGSPTGNISVPLGLSICTFFLIHIAGIRERGMSYFSSLIPSGIPAWLIPIILPIELIGFITKSFALCIRLFMNILAGHIILLSLLCLIFILSAINIFFSIPVIPVSIVMSIFIFLLELLIVAPLQAFIFTFLTAIFVGGSLKSSH